jgi:hypothetical protein
MRQRLSSIIKERLSQNFAAIERYYQREKLEQILRARDGKNLNFN